MLQRLSSTNWFTLHVETYTRWSWLKEARSTVLAADLAVNLVSGTFFKCPSTWIDVPLCPCLKRLRAYKGSKSPNWPVATHTRWHFQRKGLYLLGEKRVSVNSVSTISESCRKTTKVSLTNHIRREWQHLPTKRLLRYPVARLTQKHSLSQVISTASEPTGAVNLVSLQTTLKKGGEAPMKKLASRGLQTRLMVAATFFLASKVEARDNHLPVTALVAVTIKTKFK